MEQMRTMGDGGDAAEAGADGQEHCADSLDRSAPPRARAFLGLVGAADTLLRELDAELERRHDLSLRAYEVLLFLARFAPKGHLRMAELAEQTPLSQSRVSRLVAELEARAFVERSSADGDRRGVRIAITERGLAAFREAEPTHLAGLERRLFGRLSPMEISQLATITAKILDPPRD